MRNFGKLRVVLALLTMLGAFHLRAEAAPAAGPKPASYDCYQEMYDYGWWTCESSTGGNWDYGYVYYWQYSDGSCEVIGVECY